MNLIWNVSMPHLKILKQTPTYTIFYTKQKLWTQLVKHTGEWIQDPCLLFENGMYVGPPMDGLQEGGIYTEEQMSQILNNLCLLFQNKDVKKIWWVQYS
jgi:hypothetical protein